MFMYKVSRLKDFKQEHPSRPTVKHIHDVRLVKNHIGKLRPTLGPQYHVLSIARTHR